MRLNSEPNITFNNSKNNISINENESLNDSKLSLAEEL